MKDYLLTLMVAAAVTYVLTPLVRRFAVLVGAIKQPRERDVHTAPVPSIGGLAMYIGLAAGLLVANEITQLHDAIANTGMVSGLLAAGGLLVIIGFIDDRWGMNALTKAAGQVAAGGILVATGAQLSWLPLPGGSGRIFIPTPDQQTLLTILIVVATINAVNFIDGLDGLAAGIVAVAAISFFAYYYSLTKLVDISSLAAPALASAILIGMCLGFLPHNFAPARIFMGDTGAMLLGLLLAYAPISSINSLPSAQLQYSINRYPVIMPVLLPAVLLVIPYGDMLLAVVRRTKAGQSPFEADRKHLHHRLLDIGHSQRASVLIMYLWAAAFSGTVVWLSIEKTELPRAANHHGEPVIVFVLITAAAIVILLLLSMPWRYWGERARAGRSAAAEASQISPAVAARVPGQESGQSAGAAGSADSGLIASRDAGGASHLASGLPGHDGVPARYDWLTPGDVRPGDAGSGIGLPSGAPRPDGDADADASNGWQTPGNRRDDGNGAVPISTEPEDGGDARSVVGAVPPATDADEWGWLGPAADSHPEAGTDADR